MKMHYILCLFVAVSSIHAAAPVLYNNDKQVREEMNALILKINHDLDDLEIEKARNSAAELKALESKTRDPKLKADIRRNADNMEHSIKFHNKHHHMSILNKNKNK